MSIRYASWSILAALSVAALSAPRAQSPAFGPIVPPPQPARFVANRGQLPDAVAFTTRQGSTSVFFTSSGFVVQLVEGAPRPSGVVAHPVQPQLPSTTSHRAVNLMLDFVSPTELARPEGEGQLPGLHAFYLGNDPADWTTNVPAYGRIVWRGVWPGVDIEVGTVDRRMEYDVRVEPGASLETIVLAVRGADALRLDDEGALVADTPLGALRQTIPAAWEEDASGRRTRIEARFVVLDGMRFGFEAPARDPSRRLVIDPGLDFLAIVATADTEHAYGLAVDGVTGAVTTAGITNSPVFPTVPGPTVLAGSSDVFVMQYTPLFGAVVYSVLIGGASSDGGTSVDVDSTGAAYVTGSTQSVGYPVTAGAFDVTYNGGLADCFVTKLAPGGMALAYSTFLGGAGFDSTNTCIQVGTGGVATVVGYTESPNFPVTAGSLDRFYNGGGDLFVLQLNAAGSALVFSTFLGGSGYDEIGVDGLDVDDGGLITLGGWTLSPNFPVTPGCLDPLYAALEDGFLARLSPNGSFLLFSTFLGDFGVDAVEGVAVDDEGDVYAGGITDSPAFPVVPLFVVIGPFLAGLSDGFLAKLDASGTSLDYSTFVGGPDSDEVISVDVDRFGRAHAVAVTDGFGFPITPLSTIPPGDPPTDAVVLQIDPTATLLNYSSYLGLGGVDTPSHVALTPEGFVNLVGDTDTGASFDAFAATFSFPWVDAGFSLPGVADPQFMGDGSLVAGSPAAITLSEAPPFSLAAYCISPIAASLPFKGGVLVPGLAIKFFFGVPATGSLRLVGPWPALPAGITLWMQVWLPGPFGGPAGHLLSNAVKVTQP